MPSMAHEILVDLFKNRPSLAAEILSEVLDDDRSRFYYDLVYNSLNEAARRALEAMMKGYEYQSDFARKYVAQGHAEGLTEGRTEGLTQGRTEGLTQGRTEGLTQGRTEGLTQGRTEGRTEEAARALLTVLRARGLAVPDAVRERILAQKDPERLERWLEKAAVAASVAAVLDEPN
jgi:flagellar biosynthesis/type III secretory pathway protein FliH